MKEGLSRKYDSNGVNNLQISSILLAFSLGVTTEIDKSGKDDETY